MVGIYRLLGSSKRNLSYWQSNPNSSRLSYKKAKIFVVQKARELFSLPNEQTEELANRAGLTPDVRSGFSLSEILRRWQFRNSLVYRNALVSERMFFYCKNGMHATKESLTAIAVSMRLTVNETRMAAQQNEAGSIQE